MTEEAAAAPQNIEQLAEQVAINTPEPEGITAEAVQGNQAPAPAAPDRSVIAQSMRQALQGNKSGFDQRQTQQDKLGQLETELKALKDLGLTNPAAFQQAQAATVQKLEAIDDGQSQQASNEIRNIQSMLERIEAQQNAFQETQTNMQLEGVRHQVGQWVKERTDDFPVLGSNKAHADLVYQKMLTHYQQTGQDMSEAQAAREVETALVEFINESAPRLGYYKSEAQGQSENQKPESVTLNQALTGSQPAPSIDEMNAEQKLDYFSAQIKLKE